jgi:hypothetical protein
MMNKHKHADLIHAWADGAEIQTNDIGEWRDLVEATYIFNPHFDYRIKPKEPEWWENIPERGVLVKDVFDNIVRITATNNPRRWIPLTNEEIEAFKR